MNNYTYLPLLILFVILSSSANAQSDPSVQDKDAVFLAFLTGQSGTKNRYELLSEHLSQHACRENCGEHRAELLHQFAVASSDLGRFDEALAASASSIDMQRQPESAQDSFDLGRAHLLRGLILSEAEIQELVDEQDNLAFDIFSELQSTGFPGASYKIQDLLIAKIASATRSNDFTLGDSYFALLSSYDHDELEPFIRDGMHSFRAFVDLQAGRIKEVIEKGELALRSDLRGNSGIHLATTMSYISEAYLELDSLRKAQYYSNESIKIADELCRGTSTNFFDCWSLISYRADQVRLLTALSELPRADTVYRQTLTKAQQIFGVYAQGTFAYLHLQGAKLAAAQGDFPLAERRFRRSLGQLLRDSSLTDAAGLPYIGNTELVSEGDLIDWLMDRYNYEVARGGPLHDERALVVHDKLDSLLYASWQRARFSEPLYGEHPLVREHYERVLRFCDRKFRASGDAHYRHRAYRIIAGTKGGNLRRRLDGKQIAAGAGLPPNLLARRESLRTELAILKYATRKKRKGERQQSVRKIVLVDRQLQDLDDSIRTQHPHFWRLLQRPPLPPAEELTAAIPQDQVVIDYFLGRGTLYAITARHGAELDYYEWALPANFSEIVERHLDSPAAADSLYRLLLAPIVAELPAHINRLQLIPDADLWNVSFGALRPGGDHYLIEDYAISLAYSHQTLHRDRDRHGTYPNSLLALGVDYAAAGGETTPLALRAGTGVLTPLPRAPEEARSVAAISGGKALVNQRAGRMAFLSDFQQYGMLHFAVHGTLDELNPFNSALLLGKPGKAAEYERLPLGEIMNLDMHQRLVTLSACHAGGGPVEGAQGINSLARAFRTAGTRAVLASRWAMNDGVSLDLTTRFYGQLDQGLTPDVALQRALVNYVRGAPPEFSSPLHWANLVVVGVTGVTDEQTKRWAFPLAVTLCLGIGAAVLAALRAVGAW